MGKGKYSVHTKGIEITRKLNRAAFASMLEEHFDATEINTLIFDLSLDKDNIPGQTKREKIEMLIETCSRQNLLQELWDLSFRERPDANWVSTLWPCEKVEEAAKFLFPRWLMILMLAVALIVGIGIGFIIQPKEKSVDNIYAGNGFGNDFAPLEGSYTFEECTPELLDDWEVGIGEQVLLTCSRTNSFQGLSALALSVNIQERATITDRNGLAQLWLNYGDLESKLIVMRIFIPQDSPTTVAAHYLVVDEAQHSRFGPIMFLRPGAWNTIVWATADYEDMENVSKLGIEFKIEGINLPPDANHFFGTILIDSVEIYPLSSR